MQMCPSLVPQNTEYEMHEKKMFLTVYIVNGKIINLTQEIKKSRGNFSLSLIITRFLSGRSCFDAIGIFLSNTFLVRAYHYYVYCMHVSPCRIMYTLYKYGNS